MKKSFLIILALCAFLGQSTIAQIYNLQGGSILPNADVTNSNVGIGTNTPTSTLTLRDAGPRIRFESISNESQGLYFTSTEGTGVFNFGQGNMSMKFNHGYLKVMAKKGLKFYVKEVGTLSGGGSISAEPPLSELPLLITPKGRVGIGFDEPPYDQTIDNGTSISQVQREFDGDLMPGDYKLYVCGGILSEKVVVKLKEDWADYVFDTDYELTPLSEVEQFIKENKHLPNVPSAKEIKETGLDMEKIQTVQMQKIEELTLYMIEMQKQNEKLQQKVVELEQKLADKK